MGRLLEELKGRREDNEHARLEAQAEANVYAEIVAELDSAIAALTPAAPTPAAPAEAEVDKQEEQWLATCEARGYEAFGNGVPVNRNPCLDVASQEAWALGWFKAKELVSQEPEAAAPAEEPLPDPYAEYVANLRDNDQPATEPQPPFDGTGYLTEEKPDPQRWIGIGVDMSIIHRDALVDVTIDAEDRLGFATFPAGEINWTQWNFWRFSQRSRFEAPEPTKPDPIDDLIVYDDVLENGATGGPFEPAVLDAPEADAGIFETLRDLTPEEPALDLEPTPEEQRLLDAMDAKEPA